MSLTPPKDDGYTHLRFGTSSGRRHPGCRSLRNRRHLQRLNGNLQVQRRHRLHGDARRGRCDHRHDGGGWIFTPDPRVTTDQPDYDYLSYGFWLKKTTDEDGVLTYNEVETFARSSLPEMGSDVSAVEGSATYNGGATGVYVRNVHNSDGTLDTATAGHFTAAASLTANFGGTSVAVDDAQQHHRNN